MLPACAPCRAGHRRCDGREPCGRCARAGAPDKCVRIVRKRGRPKKRREEAEETERGGRRKAAAEEEDDEEEEEEEEREIVDRLAEVRRSVLSMALSHGQAMVIHRTVDFCKTMGLALGHNYFVMEFSERNLFVIPPAAETLTRLQLGVTVNPVFASATIVAACLAKSLGLGPAENWIGKPVKDLMPSADDRIVDANGRVEASTLSFLTPLPQQCCVKTLERQRSHGKDSTAFVTTSHLLYNELGAPCILIVSVLDVAKPGHDGGPNLGSAGGAAGAARDNNHHDVIPLGANDDLEAFFSTGGGFDFFGGLFDGDDFGGF